MEQLQQQIVEHHLLAAAQKVEDQLDNEMHQLQKLEEDDMESLRQQRLQQMKKAALKKKEWLSKGHGEYNEIASEKEFFCRNEGRRENGLPLLQRKLAMQGDGQAHANSGQAACGDKVHQDSCRKESILNREAKGLHATNSSMCQEGENS